jgi:hypothetical protein
MTGPASPSTSRCGSTYKPSGCCSVPEAVSVAFACTGRRAAVTADGHRNTASGWSRSGWRGPRGVARGAPGTSPRHLDQVSLGDGGRRGQAAVPGPLGLYLPAAESQADTLGLTARSPPGPYGASNSDWSGPIPKLVYTNKLQVSARIQHAVRKRRETTGTIRTMRIRDGTNHTPESGGPPPGYTIGISSGRGRSLAYRTSSPVIVRPISIRRISDVPSRIVKILVVRAVSAGQRPDVGRGISTDSARGVRGE